MITPRVGGLMVLAVVLLAGPGSAPADAGTLTWRQDLSSTLVETGMLVSYRAQQAGDEAARNVSVVLEVGEAVRAGDSLAFVDPGTTVHVNAVFPRPARRGRAVVVSRLRYHDAAGAAFGAVLAHVHEVDSPGPSRLELLVPERLAVASEAVLEVKVTWHGETGTAARLRLLTDDALLEPTPRALEFRLASGVNILPVAVLRRRAGAGLRVPIWTVVECESEGSVDALVAAVEVQVVEARTEGGRAEITGWVSVAALLLAAVAIFRLARSRRSSA